ncbi:putative defense protein Hdd11 [Tachysurus fulvidraco]|uniref:putative defense protein Hdd11 n=1 Tax=Tachysurus fulvidraco TaxID=1234273 RepID=UPI000F50713A|nr:putative defense protein Hdd11 [Tachysurus fulvidraco]
MQPVLFVTVWLLVLSAVTGYPTGAPVARCVDMTPGHGVPSQTSPSPYTIVISSTTFTPTQSIRVTIQGPMYLGLLLQARSNNTDAVGTWGTPPPDTKYLACSNNSQGAITHSNRNSKNNETTYTWIPPDSIESAFIRATVVANRTTFWVNLSSEKLSRASGAAAEVKMAITPVMFLAFLMSMAFQ